MPCLPLHGKLRLIVTSFAAIWFGPIGISTPAHALELTIVASQDPTAATVVTQTNNKGYNIVFWNFTLPASFTGTGAANTVTSLNFQFWHNPPQGGAGVVPMNIAIYSGFFDATKYSTTQGNNLFKPVGNSYSTPVSTVLTPAAGLNTVQTANTAIGQLNMGTMTPGVNEPYGSHDFKIATTQTPFNGTTGNASGQYSIVMWTESPQNYQIKVSGQIAMSIPGVTGMTSSTAPGYLNGSVGGAGIITTPGTLAPAPVPEPSSFVLGSVACLIMGLVARRRKQHTRKIAGYVS